MQTQSSEIQDMDRLRTYKILKTTFGCEQSVFAVKNKLYRTAMSKLMVGLLKIGCNEGQYSNTPFHERIRILCNQNVEMEYHFLRVCPPLSHIGSNHISSIWFTYPSVDKIFQLCTSKSTNMINTISRYVFSAIKFRSQYIKNMNL